MQRRKTAFILLGLWLFVGCSPKVVTVERTHTVYRDRFRIDSIYNRDTVFIQTKGDTIIHSIIKYRERYRLEHDTVRLVDSLPYPVEVVKEVHTPTRWQRFCTTVVWSLIVALVLLIAGWSFRRWR